MKYDHLYKEFVCVGASLCVCVCLAWGAKQVENTFPSILVHSTLKQSRGSEAAIAFLKS